MDVYDYLQEFAKKILRNFKIIDNLFRLHLYLSMPIVNEVQWLMMDLLWLGLIMQPCLYCDF